jgi:hypothetical protein
VRADRGKIVEKAIEIKYIDVQRRKITTSRKGK